MGAASRPSALQVRTADPTIVMPRCVRMDLVEHPVVTTDPRVDDYIAKAQDFARPVLERLRALVHKACPEVEEAVKWRMPSFEYKGLLCGMAAFKQYCTFGFWKHELLKELKIAGAGGKAGARGKAAAGGKPAAGAGRKSAAGGKVEEKAGDILERLGKIRSAEELPSDRVLLALIKEAVRLNEEGVKLPKAAKPRNAKPIRIPADFAAALEAAGDAKANFDRMSPSHKREYLEWITEAKTAPTRERRIATAVQWIAEVKPRNWKYMKK